MRTLRLILLSCAALLLMTYGAWRLSRSRSLQLYGGLITHAETTEKLVALTLDDGPTPAGTEATLALLDELGAPATFFLIGSDLAAHPELGRRIIEAGHQLANHSYSHQRMVLRSPAFVREEIEKTDTLIRLAGESDPIYFRPPYGSRLFVVPRYLYQAGRPTLLWDIEPDSIADISDDPEAMAAHVADRVRPGSIILLHVMYDSRLQSRAAIPLFVERLRQQGYRFVTLHELLSAG